MSYASVKILPDQTAACLAPKAALKATFIHPVSLILTDYFSPTSPTSWCCMMVWQVVLTTNLFHQYCPHGRDSSQARQKANTACLQWTDPAWRRSAKKRHLCFFVFVCVSRLLVCQVNYPAAEWASINSTSPELRGKAPAPRQGFTATLSYTHTHCRAFLDANPRVNQYAGALNAQVRRLRKPVEVVQDWKGEYVNRVMFEQVRVLQIAQALCKKTHFYEGLQCDYSNPD